MVVAVNLETAGMKVPGAVEVLVDVLVGGATTAV
jgi:hypothetical protein